MLQFITNNSSGQTPARQITEAIKGGCRWVEIETAGLSDKEVEDTVAAVKPLCEEKGVFLIMVSRTDLAKQCNVGGVLLRKGDAPVSKARMELGAAAVVGIEVSSLQDIIAVSNLDLDFVSITPFASGEKPLGIEGIRQICFEMEKREINIAHVACGGIRKDDVLPLLEAGANGIAVSSAIALAGDIAEAAGEFISILPLKE